MTIPTPEQIDQEYKQIIGFLESKSTIFAELRCVQKEVWESPDADEHYKAQKEKAASTARKQKSYFFQMMKSIGDKLQYKHRLIPPASERSDFEALDICMAPGGFTSTVLKHNPLAKVYGLTLSLKEGGNEIFIKKWTENPNIEIQFTDIAMLSAELGSPGFVSPGSSSGLQFSSLIPLEGRMFDLVICDGQVVAGRYEGSKSKHAATRLSCAQVILGLQRIKPDGTFVMLLHQTYRPQVVRLLEAFSHFSNIALFKPVPCHAKRNSFYIVAKNVDPHNERACRLLRDLKSSWRACTAEAFGMDLGETSVDEATTEDMENILQSFGESLVKLSKPIWKIQRDALKKQFLR
ncbi:uncharacterized protein N7483_008930 [Penicillium malachiteum]|uniref:uncharacterized protein n=1 Tax=Penicillium malachiteum TaxID=1324776 RepID=UPI0025483DE0|nr:uncharacterized protein N7483_008930 [Penicillium malachiteum]KAJ5720996.1 hypothetical protein N7483_008930 [Penicillium malachiteum]